jgi:hypothetical protein
MLNHSGCRAARTRIRNAFFRSCEELDVGLERISQDAIQRVNGPSWAPLRQAFITISEVLLGVSEEAFGVLTTIYVKYQMTNSPNSGVYAVAWLKDSKQIVVGLSLPEDYESELLGPAPPRSNYKGITRYFTVRPGESVPDELCQWATAAFQNASAKSK